MTTPPPRRTSMSLRKAMMAITAVAFFFVIASVSQTQPNNGGNQPAKKGCTIKFEGPGAGQSIEYPDGYSMSVNATDGKKHTYTCNDGTWTETVSIVANPVRAWSLYAVSGNVMTLQP